MAPNVDTLVVNHEETPEYFARSIEVDTVAMGDFVVVLHEVRCSLIVSNEVF